METYINKQYNVSNSILYLYSYILSRRIDIVEDVGTTNINADDIIRYAKMNNVSIVAKARKD